MCKSATSAVEEHAVGGDMNEISKVTIDALDARLKALEKAVLKLKLQVENLERASKQTARIRALHTPLNAGPVKEYEDERA